MDIFRAPDLSREYAVDERGVVVFPLIGERSVIGLSPIRLRESLISDFGHYLKDPSMQVTVLRRVNILGGVRRPGLYPVDPTMTLADALALAGGVAPSGSRKDVRLIRNGQVMRRRLDQAAALGRDIRSGDQVFVGERSWFSRNLTVVLSSFVAAAAITTAALIN